MGDGKENQENVECWAQKPKSILKHRDAVTAEPGMSDGCGAKLERALRASNRHESGSGGVQCAHAEEDICPVMTISLSEICDRGASANMVQTLAAKEEHNKSSPVEACELAGSQAHVTAAVSATTVSGISCCCESLDSASIESDFIVCSLAVDRSSQATSGQGARNGSTSAGPRNGSTFKSVGRYVA